MRLTACGLIALALLAGACEQGQTPDIGHAPPRGPQMDLARTQGQALQNPYCAVPTFQNEAIPYRGFATTVQSGPVIYIRADGMHDPNLYRFILAHECGHHAAGHANSIPPNEQIAIQRELEADCWGARTIAQQQDSAALMAAFNDANTQGPFGRQRIAMIQQCAAGPGQSTPPTFGAAPYGQEPSF